MCAVLFKVATFPFLQLFVPNDLRKLFLLITPVARMLLTTTWVSKRKDVKCLSIDISKLTIRVKYSINRRTSFSPNPHLVVEPTCFTFYTP